MLEKKRFHYNLLLLLIAILWPLFQAEYFSGIDGVGRIKIAISIIAIIINGQRLFQTPKIIHVWLLWIVYCIINTSIKGFNYDNIPFLLWAHHRLVFPYVMMLVAYQVFSYDFGKATRAMFGIYLIYFISGSLGIKAIESWDVGTRAANELGNAFFNTIIILATYTAILYVTKKIKTASFFLVLIFLIYIILLSGERKGLIALFMIITGSYIAKVSGEGYRSYIKLVVFLVVAYLAIGFIMANTSFGLRMNATIENTKYEDSIFLTLMGDRARQYVEGWLFFLQNPWTGIGLRKYAEVNSYWQDSGGVLHTEYIVQLAECGIIGSILFLVFYFGMIKRLFTKESNSIKIVLRSTLLAIIAVNFVAWTYDSISYFIVYGMIYAFCETSRHAQAVTHSDIRYNAVQTVSST